MRAVDLFCGAGGLSRGLTDAGFQVVAAFDSWRPAVESYRANFPTHAVHQRDLATFDFPELQAQVGRLDLVAGGPPCQGFSIQRIGDDEDDRNNLVLTFGHAVTQLRPRMFMMENVPGILGKRGLPLFERLRRLVTEAGYEVATTVVNAVDFGVPQNRNRVVLIGWLADELSPFSLNQLKPTNAVSVRDAIGDLPSPPADHSTTARDPLHRRSKLSPINQKRIALIPPGGGFESLPPELRAACHRGGAAKIGHRNVYGRLHPDRPAVTITARFDSFTRGQFAHPWEDRNITLREGARLQSFPDDHLFFGTQEEVAALIGNAIPPKMAHGLGKQLAAHLSSASRLQGPHVRAA